MIPAGSLMVTLHKQEMRTLMLFIVPLAYVLSAEAQTIPIGVPVGPIGCYIEENGHKRIVPCPDEGGGNTGGGGNRPSGPTQRQIDAQAARERRDKADAFNKEGLAAQNRGEWGIAAEQYRQAYALNPDSKAIHANLINALLKFG